MVTIASHQDGRVRRQRLAHTQRRYGLAGHSRPLDAALTAPTATDRVNARTIGEGGTTFRDEARRSSARTSPVVGVDTAAPVSC